MHEWHGSRLRWLAARRLLDGESGRAPLLLGSTESLSSPLFPPKGNNQVGTTFHQYPPYPRAQLEASATT